MKLKYQAKKRSRINSRFMGFTTFERNWWCFVVDNSWDKLPSEKSKYGFSTHQECRSVKAFRRKLKSAPKGVKFILVSRWVGYDVIGYGSK